MGTVPILDARGLCISHPQGHGELGPPHPCRMEEAGAEIIQLVAVHYINITLWDWHSDIELFSFLN